MENDRNAETTFTIFVSWFFEACFSFPASLRQKGYLFHSWWPPCLPSSLPPSQAAKLEALSNLRQGVPASLLCGNKTQITQSKISPILEKVSCLKNLVFCQQGFCKIFRYCLQIFKSECVIICKSAIWCWVVWYNFLSNSLAKYLQFSWPISSLRCRVESIRRTQGQRGSWSESQGVWSPNDMVEARRRGLCWIGMNTPCFAGMFRFRRSYSWMLLFLVWTHS